MLNAQLDRLDGMIRAMRRQKKRILKATADTGLEPIRANSPDWECGSHVMYTPADGASRRTRFAKLAGGTVTLQDRAATSTPSGTRSCSTAGGHHPAMNPFLFKENRGCRMGYTRDMCEESLEILGRTVYVQTHPDRGADEVEALIERIRSAARGALGVRARR